MPPKNWQFQDIRNNRDARPGLLLLLLIDTIFERNNTQGVLKALTTLVMLVFIIYEMASSEVHICVE